MTVSQDACAICRDSAGNLRFFRTYDKCLLACQLALELGTGPESRKRLTPEWENLLRKFELALSKAFFLPTRRTYDPLLADEDILTDGLVALCGEMMAHLAMASDPTRIPSVFLVNILKEKFAITPTGRVIYAALGELLSPNPATPGPLKAIVAKCVHDSPFPRKSWFF